MAGIRGLRHASVRANHLAARVEERENEVGQGCTEGENLFYFILLGGTGAQKERISYKTENQWNHEPPSTPQLPTQWPRTRTHHIKPCVRHHSLCDVRHQYFIIQGVHPDPHMCQAACNLLLICVRHHCVMSGINISSYKACLLVGFLHLRPPERCAGLLRRLLLPQSNLPLQPPTTTTTSSFKNPLPQPQPPTPPRNRPRPRLRSRPCTEISRSNAKTPARFDSRLSDNICHLRLLVYRRRCGMHVYVYAEENTCM